MLIKWIMGKEENQKKAAVIWNAAGGALSAGQAAIVLIFVSHKLGLFVAGMVTIAYAWANIFLTVARYGVRNYQVTDVKGRYSFGDYFYSRIITTIMTLVIIGLFLTYSGLWGGYSTEKLLVLFELSLWKLTDAFEDVYIGCYQQIGRLDVGAKIMAFRLFLSTVCVCLLVLFGSGLHLALPAGILVSIVTDIVLLRKTFPITGASHGKLSWSKVIPLLRACLPLCLGTTLSIYIGNVPKYVIDSYLSEEIQAIFGYIMMPVFVVTLLNQFIYQPVVKDLADIWKKRDNGRFLGRVWKQCGIVGAMTLAMIFIGSFVGIPVLSWLYNVELSPYRKEFFVLLLGGGFYALAYYLNVPLTTIRKQKSIAAGYAAAAILSLFLGKYFALSLGMFGVALLYLCINAMLVVVYLIVLVASVYFSKKE